MFKSWRALLTGGAVLAAAAAFYWPGSPLPEWVGIAPPGAQSSRYSAEKAPGKNAGSKREQGAARKGQPPAPVTVAEAVRADMPVILSAPGTVEPLATVGVRPRVEGHITEVAFKEGDFVEQGQVLFRLDDRLVKAQIAQAEANIAKDRANLTDAEATLKRREALLKKDFASEAATETARQTAEALKASIRAGEAQLEFQRTQLDYLMIRAPISGRTGSQSAKLGALVRTNESTPLVTINQTRPIAVAFPIPQGELPALRRALANRARAAVSIPGSSAPPTAAAITFVDNQVDRQTGSVTAKITSENGDEALWPGQAVEVALTVEVKPDVISVPAAAVIPAQGGMMVWVIGADGRTATRRVEVERIVAQTAYLTSGLNAGERVVTDGQLRLAPGAPVAIQQPRGKQAPATANERGGNGRS